VTDIRMPLCSVCGFELPMRAGPLTPHPCTVFGGSPWCPHKSSPVPFTDEELRRMLLRDRGPLEGDE